MSESGILVMDRLSRKYEGKRRPVGLVGGYTLPRACFYPPLAFPTGRRSFFGGSMYEIRPMVGFKLLNRQFEKSVLQAIFQHESECKSLVKLPKHPSTWGWASRVEIAKRMGYKSCNKTLSRKIRAAFLWLEEQGYLKYYDINEPGRENGATRFLIVFWVFRILDTTIQVFSRTQSKETSRTIAEEKPAHDKGIISMFRDLRVAEGLAG